VRTLYIRNVPDEVAERLERMAARRGVSLNALAVRELTEVAGRADNYALLADLPNLDVSIEEIVADLESGRNER
jgi:plasmid stability protein